MFLRLKIQKFLGEPPSTPSSACATACNSFFVAWIVFKAAFTRIRIARYPDIRVEGTRVSAKRLHVSRYPKLLYDTHAQCGTNMICARGSKVTAVLQRSHAVFRDFLSFMKIERTFLPCSEHVACSEFSKIADTGIYLSKNILIRLGAESESK